MLLKPTAPPWLLITWSIPPCPFKYTDNEFWNTIFGRGESGESGDLVDSQNKLLSQDEVYQNSLRSCMDIVRSGSSLAVYPVPIINDGGLENGDDTATDFFGNLIVVPKKVVVVKKDDGKNGNGDGSRSSGRGSCGGSH